MLNGTPSQPLRNINMFKQIYAVVTVVVLVGCALYTTSNVIEAKRKAQDATGDNLDQE